MLKLRTAAFCGMAGGCLGSVFLVGAPSFWAWVAYVPFFWVTDCCSPKSAFLRGWAAGAVAWAVGLHWMAPAAFELTGEFSWKGSILLSLFFCLLGLHFAIVAGVAAVAARRRTDGSVGIKGLYAVSLVLALTSAERLIPALFPPVLAISQVLRPITIQSLDLFGMAGLALLIGGFNAALYFFIRRSWERRAFVGATPLFCFLFLVGMNEVYGRYRLGAAETDATSHSALKVVVAQASLPRVKVGGPDRFEENLTVYNGLTKTALAAGKPDLVVWPQNTYKRWLEFAKEDEEFRNPQLQGVSFSTMLKKDIPHEVPVLFGTGGKRIMRFEGKRRIVRTHYLALLKGVDGAIRGIVSKRFPTPFAERVPGAATFPVLNKLFPNRMPIRSGFQEPLKMKSGVVLGTFVCYDLTVAQAARDLAAKGAQVLVTVSSDQWSTKSDIFKLHLRYAIIRAVENRRSLIRASVSGISVILAPTGRILGRIGIDEVGWISATVPLNSERTLANHLGESPYWACLVLLLSLVAMGLTYKDVKRA